MFNNAAKVIIHNSNLISADTTHHHTHYDHDPLNALKPHVIQGALFDSSERYDPPKCHPQTRIAVLRNISAWARKQLNPKSPILWLRGAAGAGKSAIAQTLSENWYEKEFLAASFFFSRTGAGRNQSRQFIATIAYQLAQTIPMTRRYIEQAIASDWRLFDRSLRDQIMALVVNPLRAPYTDELWTMAVVIDGLDECCLDYPHQNHEEQQREILEAITLAAQHSIPLRFLIASRPERQIRQSFRQGPLSSLVYKITLDSSQNPDADVELFLRFSFQEIRQKNGDIEHTWPSEETIRLLIKKSSGHFVYASTVVRYVSDPRGDPRRRLEIILGLSIPKDMLHNPFAQLDVLYFYIMASIQTDSLINVLKIFSILTDPDIFSRTQPFEGVTNFSVEFFSKLHFTTTKQIYCDLVDLHSILEIPPSREAGDSPVRFIHASFGEFLTKQSRSGPFYINSRQARLYGCIQICKHVIIASAQGHEAAEYNPDSLRIILVRGLERNECPPSRELRFGIHAAIGKWKWRYRVDLEGMGLPFMERATSIRRHLTWSDQLTVLTYLQGCNIEEVERSPNQRWLMSVSLLGQKTRIQTLIILRAIALGTVFLLSSLVKGVVYILTRGPCAKLLSALLIFGLVFTIVIVVLKYKVGFSG